MIPNGRAHHLLTHSQPWWVNTFIQWIGSIHMCLFA
jgi:hypothetical protein